MFSRMCDSKIFSCFAAEMKTDEEQEHFKCEKMIQSPHRELYHNHNISLYLQKYWVSLDKSTVLPLQQRQAF